MVRKARDLARRKGALESGGFPVSWRTARVARLRAPSSLLWKGTRRAVRQAGQDREFQAILPVKGKVINVEKARLDKVLANDEIRTMITAIGTGIGTTILILRRPVIIKSLL